MWLRKVLSGYTHAQLHAAAMAEVIHMGQEGREVGHQKDIKHC